MEVEIEWYVINDKNEHLWNVNRGLYAYLDDEDEILYIGKVDGTTVRKRFQPSAKPELWNFIVDDLELNYVTVVVGLVEFPEGFKHSRQKLADIESLLINSIKPCGNVSSRNTRISRPGLSVYCYGDWYYSEENFLDV